ncbi:cytosolic sulfotransferase 12-like [Chenopodium quinoa]|uniref:cytosolic sulfotransferase 12-like n=1 Tax=Chenopodium quinoa TaxID=63459 RepID=UPI000B76CC85|nr:cytosolic sulfotransferase 12-like [Chenopodium quinoa]
MLKLLYILTLCRMFNIPRPTLFPMAANLISTLSHAPKNKTPSPKIAKYMQEDDITQECQALISTLPKEQDWVLTHIYQYQGFWYPVRQLQGVLSCQRHFQARDTDIILTTSPKCGTTWLKALAYVVVNRKINLPRGDNHPLLSKNPHDLVPYLELKLYIDHQDPNLTKLPSPRLFSTHLPVESLPLSIKEKDCKVVYLARDPRDAFISLWHFSNKLRPQNCGDFPLEEAFDMFCKGVSFCGPFSDHVLSYWKYSLDNPKKVFFLKYEELKEQPKLYLKKLAEFWGCSFSLEEENNGVVEEILGLCSFENLSNLEVNKNGKLSSGVHNKVFFRKGEVGDWANYFTHDMIEKFDEFFVRKFHQGGLSL